MRGDTEITCGHGVAYLAVMAFGMLFVVPYELYQGHPERQVLAEVGLVWAVFLAAFAIWAWKQRGEPGGRPWTPARAGNPSGPEPAAVLTELLTQPELHEAPGELRVRGRRGGREVVGRWASGELCLGVTCGAPGWDPSPGAGPGLAAHSVQEEALLTLRATGAVLEQGRLTATWSEAAPDWSAARTRLLRLVRLARQLEQRAGALSPGPRLSEHAPGSGRGVCPYCRDELSSAAEAVVACATCSTAHHGACFQEHGGCTVLGCGGRRARKGPAERGRVAPPEAWSSTPSAPASRQISPGCRDRGVS